MTESRSNIKTNYGRIIISGGVTGMSAGMILGAVLLTWYYMSQGQVFRKALIGGSIDALSIAMVLGVSGTLTALIIEHSLKCPSSVRAIVSWLGVFVTGQIGILSFWFTGNYMIVILFTVISSIVTALTVRLTPKCRASRRNLLILGIIVGGVAGTLTGSVLGFVGALGAIALWAPYDGQGFLSAIVMGIFTGILSGVIWLVIGGVRCCRHFANASNGPG